MPIARGLTRPFMVSMAMWACVGSASELPIGDGLDDFTHYRGPKMQGPLLRTCVEIEFDHDALAQRSQSLQGPVDSAQARFDHLQRWNNERQARLDRGDADAVAAFNRSVDDESAAADSLNALLPEYNAVIAELNDARDRFNTTCAGRAYLKAEKWDVEEAVRKARQRANGG